MKKYMMIAGCEIISTNENNPDNTVFKLTLIPLTIVKKKTRFENILSEGSFEGMLDSALEHQNSQLKDCVYITMGEWKKHSYKIGRHVTIEVLPDNTTGGIK